MNEPNDLFTEGRIGNRVSTEFRLLSMVRTLPITNRTNRLNRSDATCHVAPSSIYPLETWFPRTVRPPSVN